MQAGVSAHADLQPHQVQVGEEPGGKVCLRGHLCQGLSRAFAQRQWGVCQSMPSQEKGKNILINKIILSLSI